MNAFGSYGVVSANAAADDKSRILEEISFRGFATIADVVRADEVDELNAKLDSVYARQSEEVGGEKSLSIINDADVVRCPLAYDDAFLALARNDKFVSVVKYLLGDNIVLLMQNGVINRPDRLQFQTNWHRDLNYQHWVCSKPIAISALVCLEDFNDQTGGTVFLPGSHKFERFPSPAFAQQGGETPNARRGSAILFDAMVFHRAGVNRSNRIRRGVNHVIGVPILAQQVDIPSMLGRQRPDDPWLAGYLGYRWNPVRDVREWRMRKVAEAERKAAASGSAA
jgi:ectoine hydroxylase-related dioxygenase (phytanoyl-CoA dioxygenase family)